MSNSQWIQIQTRSVSIHFKSLACFFFFFFKKFDAFLVGIHLCTVPEYVLHGLSLCFGKCTSSGEFLI